MNSINSTQTNLLDIDPAALSPIKQNANFSGISARRFTKRYFTFRTLREYFASMIAHRKSMLRTMKGKRLSETFAEKIMLAVTGVNGCTYCNYFHSKMALESGLLPQEILDISCLEFDNVVPEEAPALAFAQHFAESMENPSPKSIQSLITCYGVQKAQDIINYCRMITFGNLFGNTISAFESRLQGVDPIQKSFWFEFFIYLFTGIFIKFM